LVPGLLAGAALGLIGELIGWRAFFTDVGYSAGPAWWTLLAGTVLLVAAVVVGCSAPALRSAPRLRRDAVAALAALLVLAALGIWVFAVGSSGLPPGQWLFYKGAGVLFTIACAPAAVLRLTAAQRVFALSGLTTAAAGQVAGGVEILVHSTSGFDMGAVLRAILAVLVALAACYVGQLGRRPASALVG
jgi:hypothetical protein